MSSGDRTLGVFGFGTPVALPIAYTVINTVTGCRDGSLVRHEALGSWVGPILFGFRRSRPEGAYMKKQALTLVGVLSLVLAAGSAFAQSSQEIRANVPFNFVVNHVELPAGQYSITTIGGGNEILVLRGLNNKTVKIVNANAAQANKPADRTKLVFRVYGDRYFLSQIWTEGDERGRALPKSDLESETAKDMTTPHDMILFASVR